MKKKLYIDTGSHFLKKSGSTKNNTSNFLSLLNNKSLTTNDSATAFTSPFNTIIANTSTHTKTFPKRKKFSQKTSASNLFTGYNTFKNNNRNIIFLPNIKTKPQSIQLINDADEIISDRKKNYIGRALKQSKSSALERSKEICLHNFYITQLREKRDEINKKEKKIHFLLNDSEKRFGIDYKNFIDFMEAINRKVKEEELSLNTLITKLKNVETVFTNESNINKFLENQTETTIKKILLFKTFGSFLHKAFHRRFSLDELNNINLKGKSYISLSDKIIELYEKDKKYNDESVNIIVKDVESLMDKYNFLDEKVINIIREKDELEKEIKEINQNYQYILNQLRECKTDSEKEYIRLEKEKKELIKLINNFINFDENRNDSIEKNFEYILELAKDVHLDINKALKASQTNDVLESVFISGEIIKILKEKENSVNDHISLIEDIITNGGEKDKEIIENIINERKKFNKKEKQLCVIKLQKLEENRKKLKGIAKSRRIIIRGRKVYPDEPIFRNRNKKVKEEKNKDDENFEFLHYSTDKEN